MEKYASKYDVVVVGGGHAGSEAAVAAATLGCRTAMVTLKKDRIGYMSCNPAIGGLAKGQLVREIDALGGIMGLLADRAAIQYRQLNSSKGAAVRSSRVQCDKAKYAEEVQRIVFSTPGLDLIEDEAVELEWTQGEGARALSGIRLAEVGWLQAQAVVITAGTFLKAIMYTGFERSAGGRHGDRSAATISESLAAAGLQLKRLKTGTPPRLRKSSIDFSRTERQPGDEVPKPFSFRTAKNPFPVLPQVDCYITYTNEETHRVIERNFGKSPMFTGLIQGVGPRYCPSIEDKVKRFREKDRHQLFLEPEGLSTEEVYVNGVSTSLPADVQEEFLRTIPGLEKAEFIRHGYAVEYDAVDPRGLRPTFETKEIQGLFFAGQVNGTSGYEEAAAQGLVAGVNAARRVRGAPEWILGRSDGYIGVMVDDLVTKGVDEPYRMFTSRVEFRMALREDNSDLRLEGKARDVGLLSSAYFDGLELKRARMSEARVRLEGARAGTGSAAEAHLIQGGAKPLKDGVTYWNLLKRPEIQWHQVSEWAGLSDFDDLGDLVEQECKYEGYIRRENALMGQVLAADRVRIPAGFDFRTVGGLSTEVVSRLQKLMPVSVGQASRAPGITPAAVASLVIHLKSIEKRPTH